ncbi:DUF3892 domain-containing protein [Clostridium sp. C8-1-8]|uniref:DUF3892 domain-containing protein n=1 Tax=Clostridium sp. C8-1-8 TaxID=2698831 RepID=UPI0013682282|nr:DUF3892 domain-containing protein [Clostridium sp. C8-1-8]
MTIDTRLGHTIVRIIKNEKGKVISYELDNGDEISTSDAVGFAKQGVIKDVEIVTDSTGEDYLQCLTEGEDGENNLPQTEVRDDKVDLKQYFQ